MGKKYCFIVMFLLLPVLVVATSQIRVGQVAVNIDPCLVATEKLYWDFSAHDRLRDNADIEDKSVCGKNHGYFGRISELGVGTRASMIANGGGNALSLDGTLAGYAILSGFNSFPFNALTVMFWMKSDQTWDNPGRNDGVGLVSYAVAGERGSGSDNEFLLFYYPRSRSVKVFVDQNGGNDYVTNAIPVPGLFDGRWHHVTVTWQGSDGATIVYVDGVAKGTDTLRAGATLQGVGTLVLGQDQDSLGDEFQANQAFRGLLDEVHIENQVKSPNSIAREFNSYGRCDGEEWVLTKLFVNRGQVATSQSRAAVPNINWGCCLQGSQCMSTDMQCHNPGVNIEVVNVEGEKAEAAGNLLCKSSDWYRCTGDMDGQTMEIGPQGNTQTYTCRSGQWTTEAPAAQPEAILGDVNDDNCVNLLDIWNLGANFPPAAIQNINLWCILS